MLPCPVSERLFLLFFYSFFLQVMLINSVKDVASALGDLVHATKSASGKSINDPAMVYLKDSAKVSRNFGRSNTPTAVNNPQLYSESPFFLSVHPWLLFLLMRMRTLEHLFLYFCHFYWLWVLQLAPCDEDGGVGWTWLQPIAKFRNTILTLVFVLHFTHFYFYFFGDCTSETMHRLVIFFSF